MWRNPPLVALLCAGAALSAVPAASGSARWIGPRGYLLVTFSGSGGGAYRFHHPAQSAGGACRSPETSYGETDSYSWSYTFLVPPTGGSSTTPIQLTGSGLVSATQQMARCGGVPASTSSCTQSLRPPQPSDAGDLAYPGVNVVTSGRQLTVGALGELDGVTTVRPCTGGGSLVPNLRQGYSQLQASVSFSRAVLSRPDGYRGTFTMGGTGLYAGVPLSGACNSTSCDAATCAQDLPGTGGAPTSCSFDESYSGTIEIRVLR